RDLECFRAVARLQDLHALDLQVDPTEDAHRRLVVRDQHAGSNRSVAAPAAGGAGNGQARTCATAGRRALLGRPLQDRVAQHPHSRSLEGDFAVGLIRSGSGMTYEDATRRLVELARANGGRVTAAQGEADEELSSDHATVSAAARALGGGTNVFSYEEEDDDRDWFPFSGLVFSELSSQHV